MPSFQRKGSAEWKGDLKTGTGKIATASGAIKDTPYSFVTRFESTPGTNPEELIGAAHAACFSMALSGQLGNANLKAERISTEAAVTLEKQEPGWRVTKIHLTVTAKVPGATPEAFKTAAENAKNGCPISALLKPGAAITMDAKLA